MSGIRIQNSVGHRAAGRARIAIIPIVGAVAITLGVGTAAVAHFTAGGGQGSNGTQIGDRTIATTAVVTPNGSYLYAGGPEGGLTITINPSNHKFQVTGIAKDITRDVVVTGAVGACADPLLSMAPINNLTITVDDQAVTRTITRAVTISPLSPNGCQGATFTIPVVLTGRSL